MSLLQELLSQVTALGASDLHLKPGLSPVFRVNAALTPGTSSPLSKEEIEGLTDKILPDHARPVFKERFEADFSLDAEPIGRFRVNLFIAHGEPTIVFRHVKTEIPGFAELRLPDGVRRLADFRRGIVLACGTTGSGKSTTLATLIDHINRTRQHRIITVEDPIEYLFTDRKSMISQREIGLDTVSFHMALERILRQDPDIIMIGEMRDADSFSAALAAAETGHLVFSSLHAGSSSQSVSRILDFFPAEERNRMRMSLAANLKAVICQRLVPATDRGILPAVEIMINSPTVRKLLEKDALEKLPMAIETGTDDGMQSFNQALYRLIRSGQVTEENGLLYATNPEALKMNLKGIFLDESKRIMAT